MARSALTSEIRARCTAIGVEENCHAERRGAAAISSTCGPDTERLASATAGRTRAISLGSMPRRELRSARAWSKHDGEVCAEGGLQRPLEHRPVGDRVVVDDDVAGDVRIQIVVVRRVVEAIEAQALEAVVGAEHVQAEPVLLDDGSHAHGRDVVELGAGVGP